MVVSAQGPERAVPKDERVARARDGVDDLADAQVVITYWMDFDQTALKPGRAAFDQGKVVRTEAMGHVFPCAVDSGRAAREAVCEEFL